MPNHLSAAETLEAVITHERPKYRGKGRHPKACSCEKCQSRHRKAETFIVGSRGKQEKRDRVQAPALGTVAKIDEQTVIVVEKDIAQAKVAKWAVLRAQGLRKAEIANKLSLSEWRLNQYLRTAAKEGWLEFTDPMDRLHHVIAPKVVDNIEHFVDKRSEKMTVETAKGIGLFKSYQAVRVEGDGQATMLAININVDEGGGKQVASGTIKGVPKVIDGEVVSAIHEDRS